MLPSVVGIAARALPSSADTGIVTPADVPPPDPSRLLPVVMLLFAASGCSALIYEIVWYQLLQLTVGSTAVSLGILLATFMGGLGLGSWLLPRFAPPGSRRSANPLVLYAMIEGGIAVLGLCELLLIPLIERIYGAAGQGGAIGLALRAVSCVLVLLPPTMLMGASLPAIARWAKATPRGVSWWGLLYGMNTIGAVAGCVIAGFYLMPRFDTVVATIVAVLINGGVAVLSLGIARFVPPASQPTEGAGPAPSAVEFARGDATEAQSRVPIYVATGLSGACAMGAQIIWTRNMGLMLGATVYAFSNILAAFLVGLGLGATIGAAIARAVSPRTALGWCQILAVFGMAWAAYSVSTALPQWPIDTYYASRPLYVFQLDFARSLWAVLPATVLWGATVPIAFAAAARDQSESRDAGETVGGVYAANTFGAIVGALAVSLVLVPYAGSQSSQRILMVMSAVSGLLVLGAWVSAGSARRGVAATAAIGVCVWATAQVAPIPGALVAWGRRVPVLSSTATILETVEGVNSSFAISRDNGTQAIQFHVGGRVEASNMSQDMRMERMLGHLPALAGEPQSVLVVGFGAGVTAGTFTQYPGVTRIVICEMEPRIPPMTTRYFPNENYEVLHDPRTEVHYDDARHFVLTSKEKFDLITSDPIHPFVKGSASLYSREYFEMVRSHLNPGGVVTQWVPLYESDPATVKSEILTFFSVFPEGQIFANLNGGVGYDLVLMARVGGETRVDLDAIAERVERPDYARVRQSLIAVGFTSAFELFGTFAASAVDVRRWLSDAMINRDKDLRLQYLAGLALNQQSGDRIFRQILEHRAWPNAAFVGSERNLIALQSVLVR